MSILDAIGRTPLIPLRAIAAQSAVPVLAKCEHLNPGGSIKDRLALAIVDDAEARGVLRRGATLIEATAGNTGVGLALVAAVRGYRLVCVLPEKMSVDKRLALASLGAEVVVTPNAPPSSPENFRNVARRMSEERGWFLTEQFENPANVRIHEETTAMEILEQTGGRVGAFVAGAGTGGTISGVGRRLKSMLPNVRVVLADPIGSRLAGWVETGVLGEEGSYVVEGIGGSEPPKNLHREVIDAAERVSDDESFEMVKRLVRDEGLLVGGSSGTNVVAALRVAARDGLDGPVVTVLPDGWDRYRAKPWMQGWSALALTAALGLVGCDADGTSERAASASGSGTSTSTGEVEPTDALTFSIVREEGPGLEPAKLRMVNDTETQILSMTLPTGEAFVFFVIDPGATSEWAVVASDDMVEDAILSVHTLDTCVRRPFSEISGPTVLEPGHAYSLHVSDPDGYVAEIVEEPQPSPFIGLRTVIDDPSKAASLGAVPELVLSTASGELVLSGDVDVLPAPYVEFDQASLTIESVRLVDVAGVEHAASGPFELEGAFGFTLHVGRETPAGALHEVLLTP